jgi:tetratricopeptide (TPR) repeat protein
VRQFLTLQAQAMAPLQQQWRRMLAQAVTAFYRSKFEENMSLQRQAEVQPYVARIKWVAEQYSDALADDDLVAPYIALARLHQNQANYPAAELWYVRCSELCEQRLGPDHPSTATALNNLAALLQATIRLAEAEKMYRRGLQILIALMQQGSQHLNLEAGISNYIGFLKPQGLSDEAIQAKLASLLRQV